MDVLYKILIDPFVQMGMAPDLFVQTLWEGLVGGVLYALIALGFVLIFKASGVFNFAQGIMVVFAALTLVGLYQLLTGFGISSPAIAAYLALAATVVVMFALAVVVERVVLRPLVNQPDIVLFMATFGLTYFLIGAGEYMFGGDPQVMIAQQGSHVRAAGFPLRCVAEHDDVRDRQRRAHRLWRARVDFVVQRDALRMYLFWQHQLDIVTQRSWQ